MTTTDKTILLTGFEPFGSFTANPSALLARQLDGETAGAYRIRSTVLPVVFGEAGDRLIAAIEDLAPAWVICLGLAANRREISMERCAVNLDDADIPDNAGNLPVDQAIVGGGPPAYWSTLPVKAMVSALRELDIPASVSLSAGTYVCNHVFYRLMHHLAGRPGIRGGFVHLPPLAGQVEGTGAPDAAVLLAAVRHLVRTAVAMPAMT